MPEDFDSFLLRGQLFLEGLFPSSLEWNGQYYTCANSGSRNGEELENGGFVETGGRNLRVLKSAMPVAPQTGDRVVLDGEQLRVIEVGFRNWDVAWHLHCVPVREV